MKTMDIPKLLTRLRPNAEWAMGETYESIQWLDENQVKPTLEELEAEHLVYQKELADSQYLRDRENDPDMPTLQEKIEAVIDMTFNDDDSKVNAIKKKIAEIKLKHPNPRKGV